MPATMSSEAMALRRLFAARDWRGLAAALSRSQDAMFAARGIPREPRRRAMVMKGCEACASRATCRAARSAEISDDVRRRAVAQHVALGGDLTDRDGMPMTVRLAHEAIRHYQAPASVAIELLVAAQRDFEGRGPYTAALRKRGIEPEPTEYTTEANEPPRPYDIALTKRLAPKEKAGVR